MYLQTAPACMLQRGTRRTDKLGYRAIKNMDLSLKLPPSNSAD